MDKYSEFNEHIALLKKDESHIVYFRSLAVENINSNRYYVKEVMEYVKSLCKEWGYKTAEYWCLTYIGWCENFSNDFLKASTMHLIANEFFEREQNIDGIIATSNALLSDYLNLGEMELAVRYGIRGIELASEVNDEQTIIPLFLNTAETYVECENYDQAFAIIERLQSYNYDIKKADKIIILGILSKCELNSNNLKKSYDYCNKALELMERNNDTIEKEEFRAIRAEINYKLGNYEESRMEFEDIIKCTTEKGNSYFKIKTALRWANCYFKFGEYDLAKEKLFIATNDGNLQNFIKLRVKAYELLKDIYNKTGEYKKAFKTFQKYDEYKKESSINHSDIWLSVLKYKDAVNEAKAYKSLYKKIELISEVGRKITSSLVLDEIVQLIYNEIGKLVSTDIFGICLYNKEKKVLAYESFIDHGKEGEFQEISIDDKTSFGVYCFKNKKEVLINDIENEYWRYIEKIKINEERLKKETSSIIYLPILRNDTSIGVLTVQSDNKNAYTRDDIFGLKILASYIAIAIENGKLFNEVNYLANNDGLTGLLNRNRILKEASKMLKANDKSNSKHSVIMMDIDYFKKINDTYGHHIGDLVLKNVAKISKKKIDGVGSIGRYGGEEFLIILPHHDLTNAKKISEEIRQAIEQYTYPTGKEKHGKVTVSLGIYQFTNNNETLVDGLQKADEALYKAKGFGKNISVYYTE